MRGEEHRLDLTARPIACTCGRAAYAGSPTFVRERHAVHVADADCWEAENEALRRADREQP